MVNIIKRMTLLPKNYVKHLQIIFPLVAFCLSSPRVSCCLEREIREGQRL